MSRRWTPRAAATVTRRQLDALRKAVERRTEQIAYQWGDVDQRLVDLADELRDCLASVIAEFDEQLDYVLKKERGEIE